MIQQIAVTTKETTNNGRDKEIKIERQNPEGKREETSNKKRTADQTQAHT